MKPYRHWEVLVKCEHCEKENLAGHHDYFACAITRRNKLIESFGKNRVRIEKIEDKFIKIEDKI